MLALAHKAHGQESKCVDQNYLLICETTPPPLLSPHDYAMKIINEYFYRYKFQSMYSLIYEGTATEKSIAIDKDGKVRLNGLSADEAILLLTAVQMRDSMEQEKRYDAEQAYEASLRTTSTPSKIRHPVKHHAPIPTKGKP